jgi:hypothetical protein
MCRSHHINSNVAIADGNVAKGGCQDYILEPNYQRMLAQL